MTEPIRVLRIIARLNVGGPARHVIILDSGLRRDGFDTLLLHGDVAEGEASLEHLVREQKVPVRRVRGLGRRIHPLSDLRAFIEIVHAVFRRHPDIVHTHTAKAGVLGRVAAALYNATRSRSRRCVVVHTFHGNVLTGYFGRIGSTLVRLVERAMARLSDRIVVIADQQRHEIVQRFGIAAAANVSVIPLGLDLHALLGIMGTDASTREQFGFDRQDVLFGYVGRFVAIKDLPTLVRALAAALPRAPRARLLMVGDGELRGAIERLAADLEVSTAIRFTGWRHDLASIYAATDAGILSSRNEGTPVALIEAMAAGRPAVATDVGGVRDLVSPEITGLIVPPGDVAALADAIVRLASSPEERSRMGQAARRHVSARYGHQRLVAEIASLYRSELHEKRGAAARLRAGEWVQ